MYSIDRPIKERTRAEIEAQISGMGDYVKMSYLQRALKSGLDFETKKYVLIKLTEIYEQRKMFLEAAKMIRAAAEINTTFKDKIRDFMRSVRLYINANDFVESDRVFAQALALGNDREKLEMKGQYKDYYLNLAKDYSKVGKRNQAKIVYEKILTLELNTGERTEVQKNLLDLYEKLGNVREFMNLKRSL